MTAAARTQDRITQPVDAHLPRANHPQTAHDPTHEAHTEPPLGRPAGRQSPPVRMFFTVSRAAALRAAAGRSGPAAQGAGGRLGQHDRG
jgi:hypothetical protein